MAIQTNTVFLSGFPLVCPMDLFGQRIPPIIINDEVLFRYVADRRLELASDFVGSVSTSDIATTLAKTYLIKRDGFNIGKIEFPAGGIVGVFSDDTELGDHIILTGQSVTVVGPAAFDATHARISWTLQATFT